MIKGMYTHPRFMDVYMDVQQVVSVPNGYQIKVSWWNQSGYHLGVKTKHRITFQKAREFKRI